MKKLGIVLLALGLIAAFSMSASAADVKFSGEYYAFGSYMSNPSLLDKDQGTNRGPFGWWNGRLRVFTEYKVAEGLTLTSRFDALETMWGQSSTDGVDQFSFERAYVTFKTKAGTFSVGHQGYNNSKFGTTFFDSTGTYGGVKYTNEFGPVKVTADWFRINQGDTAANNTYTNKDINKDVYEIAAEYKAKAASAGLNVQYWRDATNRNDNVTASSRFKREFYMPNAYVKTKVGPVDLEAEGYWVTGDWRKYETSVTGQTDVKVDAKGLYAGAKYTIGPAFVGARFIYMSGDDPTTSDKIEGGGNATSDLRPMRYVQLAKDNDLFGTFTSIIFNGTSGSVHDVSDTVGNSSVGTEKYMDNVWFYQLYGGAKVMKNLDLLARYAIMKADQVVAGGDKSYGSELDVKASYSIYDNLTYNVGAAYLWVGDYFKGDTAKGSFQNTANDYLITHWIDLNF